VPAKKSIHWRLTFPGDVSAPHDIAKAFLTLSLTQSGEI
jgi:hypothetical protein